MVASESDLKRMWEGFSKSNKHFISDHVWMSAGGDFEDENYEKAIASCNHPKTINMFKNIILYVNNGSSGELYVENKDTGEYENRFYP